MSLELASPPKTPVLQTDAIRICQGGRTVYHFGLRMSQFDDALPEDVDPNVIGSHQRRFIASHAKNIEDYLTDRDDWLFGPVALSIAPDFIEFRSHRNDGQALPDIGELTIKEGARSALRIIDGQHRRKAIQQFLRASLEGEEAERRSRFQASQMPVALYVEEDGGKIRQMFADMAQQRNMDAVTRARFDTRDPYNRAADQMRVQSEWITSFVELNRSTVARSSEKLISFNHLVRCLKTLEHGYGGRVSRAREKEAELEFDRIVDRGVEWLDDFLPSARGEYLDLVSLEVDPDYVPKMRDKTFAYSATMLQILAACRHEWGRSYPNRVPDDLADFIRTMDFNTHRKQSLLARSGAIDVSGATLVGGRNQVKNTIRAIVEGASMTG